MTERDNTGVRHHLEVLRGTRLDPAARIAVDSLASAIELLQQEQTTNRHRIAELERQNAELAELSVVDELTKLGNVRALNERRFALETLMQESLRSLDVRPYAVVVASADLVGLKTFNKLQGQAVGDEAIRIAALSLSGPFREHEWFRRGGDEFIGLMPVESEEGLQTVLGKLKESVPRYYTEAVSQSQYQDAPGIPFPEQIPILCGYSIYDHSRAITSLFEAERLADPKTETSTRGRIGSISFSS